MTRDCLADIDVAILAGGLATRLKGELEATPKVMAPIAGRPFLQLLLDWLRGYGARRAILGLGHLAEIAVAYLERAPSHGIEVVPVIEPEPLGTAGAVRLMRAHLRSDPVMVLNGDSFVAADLCAFAAAHAASETEASLLCTRLDDARRYGRVTVSSAGRIESFTEKDASRPGAGIVNAGVYLFGTAMLDRIEASSGSSLERDVFASMPPGSLNAVTGRFPFIDIGTPECLSAAAEVLAPYVSE